MAKSLRAEPPAVRRLAADETLDALAPQFGVASFEALLRAFVEGRIDSAKKHLEAAAKNRWGQSVGGGPGYMGHVARVHLQELSRKAP